MSIEYNKKPLWTSDNKDDNLKEVKIIKGEEIPEEIKRKYKENTLNE